MISSIQTNFFSKVISDIDVTGRLPEYCTCPIHYARAREIKLEEGKILMQYYSDYLFFIEFYELQLEKELKTSYIIKKPSFFLFLMLGGHIGFSTFEGKDIGGADKGAFYVNSKREGTSFINNLRPGAHKLCCITPRSEWLERKVNEFPALENFIKSFLNGDHQNRHMPVCTIDGKTYKALENLFNPRRIKGVNLEAQILNRIIEIFKLYSDMIATRAYIRSYTQKDKIRMVKQYIDDNCRKLKIGDISEIADRFYFARRTLTRAFKDETGYTIQEYIEKSKLDCALKLLKETRLSIREISNLSGYPDQNYFSRVFRKQFGSSPKNIRY